MRPFWSLRFVAATVVSLILGVLPLAADAAATLVNLRVDPQPNGGAIVTLVFAGPAPTFHVLGAGTAETSVIFDETTLGPQTPPTVAGSGPVTSASLSSNGTSASLALHLSGPGAPVSVSKRSNAIVVVVPALKGGGSSDDNGAATPAATTGLGSVTEVVTLKYADVSEVAGILVSGSNVAPNDNFQPVVTNIGTSSLGGAAGGSFGGFQQSATQPQTFGGFAGQAQGFGQRLNDNIAIDRRLNAIVLTGSQDLVNQYKAAIDKIDVPLPSVLLEAQILELSDTAAKNVGLDLSPDGSGVVVNGSGSSTGTAGYTIHSLATAQGQLTFNANLYAQITLGNGRVLARPRILAQSGQPASILTGDAIPIVTNVVFASSSVASSQQVNYVNVGVNLQIQPRVSPDGYVTSHIYSDVSDVTSFNAQGIPQISQRTASTIATVRDGESFVIGGLLEENELRNLTKLPFIGDIPIIGQLFRHYNTSHTRTNLYIIVTPHVVAQNGVPTTTIEKPQSVPSALPQLGPPAGPSPAQVAPTPLPLGPPGAPHR